MPEVSEHSVSYARERPRTGGADQALRCYLAELVKHVGVEQARALSYASGVRMAAEHPLGAMDKLADLQQMAQRFLSARDWGWLRIEERPDAVDFLHGGSPLRAWFGESGLSWAPALFEGLYSGWLRQLGASERLELRQVEAPSGPEDMIRFQLGHESRFKNLAGSS